MNDQSQSNSFSLSRSNSESIQRPKPRDTAKFVFYPGEHNLQGICESQIQVTGQLEFHSKNKLATDKSRAVTDQIESLRQSNNQKYPSQFKYQQNQQQEQKSLLSESQSDISVSKDQSINNVDISFNYPKHQTIDMQKDSKNKVYSQISFMNQSDKLATSKDTILDHQLNGNFGKKYSLVSSSQNKDKEIFTFKTSVNNSSRKNLSHHNIFMQNQQKIDPPVQEQSIIANETDDRFETIGSDDLEMNESIPNTLSEQNLRSQAFGFYSQDNHGRKLFKVNQLIKIDTEQNLIDEKLIELQIKDKDQLPIQSKNQIKLKEKAVSNSKHLSKKAQKPLVLTDCRTIKLIIQSEQIFTIIMILVTISLIPLNLKQNSIMQRVILAILQMLVAISYWLIADNKEKQFTMTKLILQVFQFMTITYSLHQDDKYFQWLYDLRIVTYVIHSFIIIMPVLQYFIIIIVLVGAEMLHMINREKEQIEVESLVKIGLLIPILISCRFYQQQLLRFLQQEIALLKTQGPNSNFENVEKSSKKTSSNHKHSHRKKEGTYIDNSCQTYNASFQILMPTSQSQTLALEEPIPLIPIITPESQVAQRGRRESDQDFLKTNMFMNITMTDKSLKTQNSMLTRSRLVAHRPFDQVLEGYFQCQQALIFKVINNTYTQ